MSLISRRHARAKPTAELDEHGKPQRGKNDFDTPVFATELLIPYLQPSWRIWEPAAGRGHMVRTLRENGRTVVSSTIEDGQDFLTYTPEAHWDVIVTNPPYGDGWSTKFIQRCFEIGSPWALLLPLYNLEGQARMKMYREYGGIQALMPPTRINFFTPTGKSDRHGSSADFYTCWITIPRSQKSSPGYSTARSFWLTKTPIAERRNPCRTPFPSLR